MHVRSCRGTGRVDAVDHRVGPGRRVDRDFFRILRAWATRKAGGNGTTGQFVALAERISGERLDGLFDAWLFTAGKPSPAAATATAAGGAGRTPPAAASLLQRMSKGALHRRS